MSFLTSGLSDFVRSMVKDDFHSSDSESESGPEDHLSGTKGSAARSTDSGKGAEGQAALPHDGNQQQRFFNRKFIRNGVTR